MIRAAVYARISEDRDETKLGVTRQQADCAELAEQKGWTVVDTFVDNDISAFSGKHRPEYRRLLDAIRAGDIEAVVVWHLDRLHRQPKELEELIDLCEGRQIKLASVSGRVDLATPEGRLHARIVGAVARMESEHKSRRIRRKMVELAQAGRPHGGSRLAYGYERDGLTVVDEEAAAIREAAERVLAGDTLRSICADFNARGIRPKYGKGWWPSTLRVVLMNHRIAGLREHRGEVVGQAVWPAIIPPATSARLRSLLGDPRRRTTRGNAPRSYMLNGLLQCGQCGVKLIGRPKGRKKPGGKAYRTYCCVSGFPRGGCGKIARGAESVERLIVGAVLERIETPELLAGLVEKADENEATEIEAITADQVLLDELARAYAEKKITINEWLIAREPIEQRMAAARDRFARRSRHLALADVIGAGSSVRERWESLNIDRRRAIIASVLDHALVYPVIKKGRRPFDPSLIEPVWRA